MQHSLHSTVYIACKEKLSRDFIYKCQMYIFYILNYSDKNVLIKLCDSQNNLLSIPLKTTN